MTEILKAIVIGVVQALTEFLPVSSSGHMVLTKAMLRIEEVGITIEIVTHFATALAVIVYLRHRIGQILKAVVKRIVPRGLDLTQSQANDTRLFVLVIVGSVPAAVVGLLLRDQIGRLFEDVTATSVMLLVTGVFVLVAGRLGRPRTTLGLGRAVIIGIAQACAIVPGLSRSGLTIGSGLLTGVERREAFEFSLLLSLPAILGAGLVETLTGRIGGDPIVILAAAIPAFAGGYLAITLLFRAVVHNRFSVFAYYLIPLALLLLFL
jgi:undecaprenyl-diphosphatase